jgi:hypothetical protein
MKKLEATITVDNLVSTMKNINAIREDPKRTNEIFRAAGFLEGILYTTGRLVPGKQLVFKNITYVEIGWIGQKRIKTREQTYMELMVEMMEEFIKELT